VLAAELRACGVDLSFTPVLDLDWGRSSVIGDRSFHSDPAAVVELAGALIEGLHRAGMAACGKHFPGHGWVEADSHVALPIDERRLDD
jgi:beta-N-acetylhexosaminidase